MRWFFPISGVLAICLSTPSASGADGPRIAFDRDIRPILADKCFACHGPDEQARESGLRLDLREEALKPAESGRVAIVPGKPDESRLVAKTASATIRSPMPPKSSNKTLSDDERRLLREWIAQGAEYTTHWSFRTPSRVDPPRGDDARWSQNPIDSFLLARMKSEGLSPSPEADRATLIRRVTLDLTGLPPTLAEVDAFLADPAPDAYEKVVDRLLASPRYGERMALDWLDASRFADTHGYHIDAGRDMSRWRAWVIDSFNNNKPFDQFAVEQIAGDLLPDATLDQKIASGFNRNHMINFEGGAVPEEYHTAYIVDRVNTTGTVWLGLTIGCAQCHDHKFDPITQKDYYGLYAFFHNVPEQGLDGSKGNAPPLVRVPSPEQSARFAAMQTEIQQMKAQWTRSDERLDAAQSDWEASALNESSWTIARPSSLKSSNGATLTSGDDGIVVVDGTNPAQDDYTLVLPLAEPGTTAVKLEVLPDDRYPEKGPGRSVNGNIVMTGVRLELVSPEEASRRLPIRSARSDFHQDTFPIEGVLDENDRTGWAIYPETGKPHEAVFVLEHPATVGDLKVSLQFRSQFASHQPGRFRLLTTSAANPADSKTLPAPVRDALAVEDARRSESQRTAIRDFYRSSVNPETRELAAKIQQREKELADAQNSVPTAMVMAEMEKPRDTFVLMRGQYDQKGEKVEANVPGFLPPLDSSLPRNRLGLARWLVSDTHPLTARVAVNRFWQTVFGAGLVRTSEDFGSQGELPSHPDLLDWLAVELVNPSDGSAKWDVKRMIRLMVTSAAYRQSSVVTEEGLAKDPENRWLSRASRLRLPAEFLRDQALFASGLLRENLGGPSVFPYNPPNLWEELMSRSDGANWSAQTYTPSHGDDLYRRTMYTFWKRTCPPPSLSTFDAPDREVCTVRRARTNTPLQALVMMNDPTYVEASRKMAERILKEGGKTDDDRLRYGFRLATSRLPNAEEMAVLKGILRNETTAYAIDPKKAIELLSVGESPRDETLAPETVAAWSAVSGVLLNLDEVITKG